MGPWRRGCGRSRCSAVPVGWQDSRAVRDSRGQCGEKGPLPGKIFALCIPERRLLGFSDTWRAYLAKPSSFWMHGGDMLPGRGAFPSGSLRGCMKRKNCHGLPPGNAPRRNLATDCRPGTHRGEILPPPVTRERISRRSCHGRTPGFASRRITIALPQNNAKGRIRGTPHQDKKEGERFARLLSLFSFTARVARTFEVTSRPP